MSPTVPLSFFVDEEQLEPWLPTQPTVEPAEAPADRGAMSLPSPDLADEQPVADVTKAEPSKELPVQYNSAGMQVLPRLRPCPHCGESLVEKSDHRGKWYGHRDEAAECWGSTAQIHDEVDAKRWNARPEKALPAPKPLKDKQLAFVIEYCKDKNATQAAIRAGYSAKSARYAARDLLTIPHIRAAVDVRLAEYARTAGIEFVDIVSRLKRLAFTDITEVLGGPGGWPDQAVAAVKHYDAGGPQSSQKVTLHDQPKILFELWDRLFPGQGAQKPAEAAQTNVQVNIDKMLVNLRKAVGQ